MMPMNDRRYYSYAKPHLRVSDMIYFPARCHNTCIRLSLWAAMSLPTNTEITRAARRLDLKKIENAAEADTTSIARTGSMAGNVAAE